MGVRIPAAGTRLAPRLALATNLNRFSAPQRWTCRCHEGALVNHGLVRPSHPRTAGRERELSAERAARTPMVAPARGAHLREQAPGSRMIRVGGAAVIVL